MTEQTAAAPNQQEIDAEASARAEMVEAAIAVRAALDAEARAALDAAVAEAVAAERERCARLVETNPCGTMRQGLDGGCIRCGANINEGWHEPTTEIIAATIRGGDDV